MDVLGVMEYPGGVSHTVRRTLSGIDCVVRYRLRLCERTTMGNHNLVDQEHWNHDGLNHRNIDWVESPIKIYQVESPVMLDRVRNPGETEHCQL